MRNAIIGKHFADPWGGVGKRAEGDDDVTGAGFLCGESPLDVAGDLDDLIVRAGGLEDLELVERGGGGGRQWRDLSRVAKDVLRKVVERGPCKRPRWEFVDFYFRVEVL